MHPRRHHAATRRGDSDRRLAEVDLGLLAGAVQGHDGHLTDAAHELTADLAT